MATTIEGTFCGGRIELNAVPAGVPDQTPVVVTFLHPQPIDLQAHGIDRRQAEELRSAFATFNDWDDPLMDEYDDYDGSKSKL